MRQLQVAWGGGTPTVVGGGECRPDGTWITLLPGRKILLGTFEATTGEIPLPGEDLIYPRIPEVGSRILGIGHRTDQAIQWTGWVWVADGLAFGPDAVIYDAADQPAIIRPPGPAVGYRYVAQSGALVTCDQTRADPARGLWDYTDGAEVAVGQGGDAIGEGAVVRFHDDGILRRLAVGMIRNVHLRQVGQQVAITLVNLQAQTTTFLWGQVEELRQLAAIPWPPPEKPPVVPPIPPVDPPPVEPPVDPPPVEPPPVQPPIQPPKEPVMVYVDMGTPDLRCEPCEEIDNHNGTVSYRKVSNRMILSKNPQGGWEERTDDFIGGPFESFLKGGKCLVANRDWDGAFQTFLVPYEEIR